MSLNFVIFAVLWLFFGIIAYGGMRAECDKKCKKAPGGLFRPGCNVAQLLMLAFGPAGFVVIASLSKFKHGIRFR